ncbi:MAG TPA: PfkB family carbohydrate kinase [Gaiellaceae bacterium]|nr:PfkB family carbohydrate kinase [Gaiellaceae bacterium]
MSALALIGNLAVDRIGAGAPRAGGGVFHGARAAERVGADAVVVTRCAEADRDVALAPLEATGIPVLCADAHETTAFSFHYDGDRRVMSVDAVGDPWTVPDVDGWAAEALRDARWVLVAGLLRSHFPADTLVALARGGRRLLLDGQGILRVARRGPLERDSHVDRRALEHLTALKLSEGEARILAGTIEVDALRALGVPEILVTLGSRGALVVTRETAAPIAPHPVPAGADPTGAGDAFSLAYLDARVRGLDPVPAAEWAARIASEVIAER